MTIQRGYIGERIAEIYLREQLYTIIVCNYRSVYGEVDIICKKLQCIHFVEVKYWKYGIENLEFSIDLYKQTRISRTASIFIYDYTHYSQYDISFDVLYIDENNNIKHLINAFEYYDVGE